MIFKFYSKRYIFIGISCLIMLVGIIATLTALQDAATRMGRSPHKRAELELALVSLCEPTVRMGYDALLKRIEYQTAVDSAVHPAEICI